MEPYLKPHWHEHVDAMTHAYNCTQHDSTGYTPYYLMFSRHPSRPGLRAFYHPMSHANTVSMCKLCMTVSHMPTPRLTRLLGMLRHNRKSTTTKRQRVKTSDQGIDSSSKCVIWRAGRNLETNGSHTLWWRNSPAHLCMWCDQEMVKVVHRNLITQCMFLPVEQAGEESEVELDTAGDEEMYDTE